MNKAIWRTMTSTMAVGSALLSGAASAQQASVTSDAANAGEIVVTAQRRSEALEKTPVAITVVSSVTLAKQAIGSDWRFTGFLANPRNGKHPVLHIQSFQQETKFV